MRMDIKSYMLGVGQQARAASAGMARAATRAKNDALTDLARLLRASDTALQIGRAHV
jgi:glutamate-5-semialdehyde dehydrogenase